MLFKWLRFLLLACSLAPPANAQTVEATAGALQAALLYNFAAYTDWPALPAGVAPAENTVFCVMGSPTVFEALAGRQNKTLRGKVMQIKAITSSAQATTCQVLFVGQDEHRKIREISQVARSVPLLLVAEENGFDPSEVTIVLRQQDGRYTFKINQTAAQARSLTLSAKLLKLAAQVY